MAALAQLPPRALADLAAAGFEASFAPEEAKAAWQREVEAALAGWEAGQQGQQSQQGAASE